MKKKLNAKKFYYLYFHLTELIPLFSYLERLNAFKMTFDSFLTTNEGIRSRASSVMTLVRNRKGSHYEVAKIDEEEFKFGK